MNTSKQKKQNGRRRMRNKRRSLWLIVLVVAILAGAAAWLFHSSPEPAGTPGNGAPADEATLIVQKMSPEDKIGQLMMIGLAGQTIDDATKRQLEYTHAGNIILFDRNMDTPEQVQHLTEKLDTSIKKQSGVMPFIALDQEGGQVLRMRKAFPPVPSEQYIGQTGQAENARKWAIITGAELKKLGINVNFAPVVDLGSKAERSYSIDPGVVTSFAREACAGYAEAGVWCSLKHFPGIGKVKTDPHLDGDAVDVPKDQLMAQDLKPFEKLIKTVPNDKMFIMVSNVTFPALDDKWPACVSSAIMTGLLRHGYGYEGLIVSDDMEMGAMAKHYAFSDMGVMAIKAGADMVLVCHEYQHERETYDGLLRAYKKDADFRKVVDDRGARIIRTKLNKS